MNFLAVSRLLGLLILVIGLAMFLPLVWALYYQEATWSGLLLAAMITSVSGFLLFIMGNIKRQEVFRKEALATVGLGWLLAAAFGALPFLYTGTIPHYIDAYFETMSGFTTTGSSIIINIEALPKSVLFWRSLTHWLGGMGIIVLFIAILPFLGAGGRHLYKSEVPGLVREALTPKIKETAMILWKIYLFFTIAETSLLMISGLNLFEALCHTFGTLATGGFSTKNLGIAYFNNVFIEIIIIVFMFLAGTNFSLHFNALRHKPLSYFRDSEWRTYVFLLLSGTFIVSFELWIDNIYKTPLEAFRYALFQVVSIMTTTGYCTADFNTWPPGSKVLLVVFMFIGGCAGSTGGGLKVIRWLTLVKTALYQIEKVYRPRSVRKIKIGKMRIDESLQIATLTFFFIAVCIFISGTFIIAFFRIDMVTSATAVAATLNNIGPGLERVGAIENYSHFPYIVKALLALFMVLGRLELFSILVLFMPRFWRS